MNRTQFVDLVTTIRGISESEFIWLSREAVSILGDHYSGRSLERVEARIERLLLDSESVLSQIKGGGSWLEWSLHNRVVWGSSYPQMKFIGALACDRMAFDAWEVSERCAEAIYRAEIRFISKLKMKGSFPVGIMASCPCSPVTFDRLNQSFGILLRSWSNVDIVVGSLLAQRENCAKWKREQFIKWADGTLRRDLSKPRCQEGLRLLFDWAESDPVALEFIRMIGFETETETWRGVVEGIRRHKDLHPCRGWALNLDSKP